jgi:hypothetical protein
MHCPTQPLELFLPGNHSAYKSCPSVKSSALSYKISHIITQTVGDLVLLGETTGDVPTPGTQDLHRQVFDCLHAWRCAPRYASNLSPHLLQVCLEGSLNRHHYLGPGPALPVGQTPPPRTGTYTKQTGAHEEVQLKYIHEDLAGPLPLLMSRGFTYMFTMSIVDRTSHWPEVIPIAATTTDAFFQGWVSRFSVPVVITSDRGVRSPLPCWTICCKYTVTVSTTRALLLFGGPYMHPLKGYNYKLNFPALVRNKGMPFYKRSKWLS